MFCNMVSFLLRSQRTPISGLLALNDGSVCTILSKVSATRCFCTIVSVLHMSMLLGGSVNRNKCQFY